MPQYHLSRARVSAFVLLCLVTTVILAGTLMRFSSAALVPATGGDEILRFAHLSDVHYDAAGTDKSWRLLKDSPVLLEEALKEIQTVPRLDFLLFTGDSVNTPRSENFEGFFGRLHQWNHFPFYMVLGNHDVGVKPGHDRQYTIDAFRANGGINSFPPVDKGYYSVTPKPWLKLIVLDFTTDEKVSANGFVPQEELDWLHQELGDAHVHQQMVVMAAHFPVIEPFHSSSHEIIPADAAKLLAEIEACPNVVAYLAGHYHAAKIMKRNGIYFITSPALVEYPDAFRVITLHKNGEINVNWHPTPFKELSQKSKSRSPFWQTALGNPALDHSLVTGQLRYHPGE